MESTMGIVSGVFNYTQGKIGPYLDNKAFSFVSKIVTAPFYLIKAFFSLVNSYTFCLGQVKKSSILTTPEGKEKTRSTAGSRGIVTVSLPNSSPTTNFPVTVILAEEGTELIDEGTGERLEFYHEGPLLQVPRLVQIKLCALLCLLYGQEFLSGTQPFNTKKNPPKEDNRNRDQLKIETIPPEIHSETAIQTTNPLQPAPVTKKLSKEENILPQSLSTYCSAFPYHLSNIGRAKKTEFIRSLSSWRVFSQQERLDFSTKKTLRSSALFF